MRNLKRVLALAMAMIMMLGMMVIGTSAASYKDAETISEDYAEAVDVLTGLGVFKGTSTTETVFAPKAVLSRAEAATLIYRVITGDVTDAQTKNYDYASLKDVKAGSWYTGYVTYANNGGYIKGDENGNFNPKADVTGIQVIAIMLRAAGYGQNGEYEGSAWKDNILTDAKELGIIGNISTATLNAPATRELVAQLIFNALTEVNMVSYSALLGYLPITISNKGQKATQSLGEKVFALNCFEGFVTYNAKKGMVLTEDTTVVAVADQDIFDAGRYGHVWTKGVSPKAITGVYYDDTLLATKFDGAGLNAWTNYSKTNKNYVADYATDKAGKNTAVYFYNGEQVKTIANDNIVKGTEVALYSIDGKTISSVVVINPIVDVMAADYLTKNGAVKIQGKTFDADEISGYEDLVKGDVFTYVDMFDDVRYYEELEAIEGQKSAYTNPASGDAYITFGGETYEQSVLTGTTDNVRLFSKVKTTFDKDGYVYLDRGGYVVYTSWTAAAKTEYGMIIDTYSVLNDAHTAKEYYANILTADGEETGYVEVAKFSGENLTFKNILLADYPYTVTNDAIGSCYDLGVLVAYTVKDGVYTLIETGATSEETALSRDYNAGAATMYIGRQSYAVDNASVVFYYFWEQLGNGKNTAHYGVNTGKYTSANTDGIPSYGGENTAVDYLIEDTVVEYAVFNGMTKAQYEYAYIFKYVAETTTSSAMDIYTYYGVNGEGEIIEFSARKGAYFGSDVVGNVVYYIENLDGYTSFGYYSDDTAALAKVGTGNTVMVRGVDETKGWSTYTNAKNVYDLTSTTGLKAGDTLDQYDFYWDKTVLAVIIGDWDDDTDEMIVEAAFVIDEDTTFAEVETEDDTYFVTTGKHDMDEFGCDEDTYYYVITGEGEDEVKTLVKGDAKIEIKVDTEIEDASDKLIELAGKKIEANYSTGTTGLAAGTENDTLTALVAEYHVTVTGYNYVQDTEDNSVFHCYVTLTAAGNEDGETFSWDFTLVTE